LISKEEIVRIIKDNFANYLKDRDNSELKNSAMLDTETFIAIISRIIVNMFVTNLLNASIININEFIYSEELKQTTFAKYVEKHKPDEKIKNLISYETPGKKSGFIDSAKSFENTITSRVLSSYDIQSADAKGKYIIRKIFQ